MVSIPISHKVPKKRECQINPIQTNGEMLCAIIDVQENIQKELLDYSYIYIYIFYKWTDVVSLLEY